MRDQVWRKLSALRSLYVDPHSGEEAPGSNDIDALYTKQDLDGAINEALVGVMVDLTVNNNTVLADQTIINVVPNVVEYALPNDMAMLRSLWWKDPSIPYTSYPPNSRTLMHQMDLVVPGDAAQLNGIPTYRRQLNYIVLNDIPTADNVGGIEVRYVKWANFLIGDQDVIETQYAPLVQRLVILGAAISLASQKAFLDVSDMRTEQKAWAARLIVAARLGNMPPFAFMVPMHPNAQGVS